LTRINIAYACQASFRREATQRREDKDGGSKVSSIVIMLLLLAGFYGLFVGLVLFSQGVIEPDSSS
jgi:hypothetical protein